MSDSAAEDKWTTTIRQLFEDGKLTSHQCIVYNQDSETKSNDEKCGCQRHIRHHSFDGIPLNIKPKPEDWNVNDHTRKLKRLIYHSTPSRKVSLYKNSSTHYNRRFSLIIYLVLTMFM
jgi:hypothetical protein